MKKQEVCKYYLAQTCLKGLFKIFKIFISLIRLKIEIVLKIGKIAKIKLRIN